MSDIEDQFDLRRTRTYTDRTEADDHLPDDIATWSVYESVVHEFDKHRTGTGERVLVNTWLWVADFADRGEAELYLLERIERSKQG